MKIKHKGQILKAAREKQQITHKGVPINTTADLSIGTLEVRGNEKYTTKITLPRKDLIQILRENQKFYR